MDFIDDEPCESCGGEHVQVGETPDGDLILFYCPDCGDRWSEIV